MENFSNELLIESAELNLLVTEGIVDKTNNMIAVVIKKFKELIRKIKDFIMSKLKNDLKKIKYEASLINKDSGEYSCVIPNKEYFDKYEKVFSETHKLIKEIFHIDNIDNFDDEKINKLFEESNRIKQEFPLTITQTIKGSEYSQFMINKIHILSRHHDLLLVMMKFMDEKVHTLNKFSNRSPESKREMKCCKLLSKLTEKVIKHTVDMKTVYQMSLLSLLKAQRLSGETAPKNT